MWCFTISLQKEREAKKAELQKIDAEVQAWRKNEVAKRDAKKATSVAMRVSTCCGVYIYY